VSAQPHPGAGAWRRDLLVTALVSAAHGTSHFFQLVLPPLFPFLIAEFDVSYTALGTLMTTFFITSGFGQPLSGFAVDRFGARRVLLGGLGLYVLAITALALAPSFWLLFPAVAVAALGNSVFHPADFTLLNANVRPGFLGRAFGVHTLGGNLGWALAPVFMLMIARELGWQAALGGAALLGASIWTFVWWHREWLEAEPATVRDEPGMKGQVAMLLQSTILLCFMYFLLLAAALIAVQNFLPSILGALYETPAVLAGTVLSGFLLGAAAGVLCGGFLADRSARHAGIIMGGLVASGCLLLSVAYLNLDAFPLVATLSAAGFLSGITTPSRDLLVRAATPPGATGRIFGFVYSGLDVGSALAPITIGVLLDSGRARIAMWLVAAFMLAAVFTIGGIRSILPARRPAVEET